MSDSTDFNEWVEYAEIAQHELNDLSDYAFRSRYPGEMPVKEDAQAAYKIAKAVRKFARTYLNLK